MNKFLKYAATAVASLALITGSVVSASAAPVAAAQAVSVATATKAPAVSIGRIGVKTVNNSGKATVKPVVSTRGDVKVLSKTLTVKRNGAVVVKNKNSASLKAGTYKVTTKVKYWSGMNKFTVTKTQSLVVLAKPCNSPIVPSQLTNCKFDPSKIAYARPLLIQFPIA